MRMPAVLVADLVALTVGSAEPANDLQADIIEATRELRSAVDSYIGFTINAVIEDCPVDCTVFDDEVEPGATRTSLRIPLSALTRCEPDSFIVFYAITPGAFVDFAADLSYTLELAPGQLVLDQDLAPPERSTSLHRLVDVNQALGVLYDRGDSPRSAQAELHRAAAATGVTIDAAARAIIASATTAAGAPPPQFPDDGAPAAN